MLFLRYLHMHTFRRVIKPRTRDILVTFFFGCITALLVWAALWDWHSFMKSPPYVDPVRYPINGIDVSAHNGMMNLDAAAEAGIRFIFIKASEGATFRDENFRLNYNKARHAGMKIGAYHFFRFDRDGIEQARNVLGAIAGRRLDLGIVIDVEDQGNARVTDQTLIAKRLLEMTEFLNLCGYKVTFYSNRDGYYQYLLPTVPGNTLWICSFSPTPINAEWTFWQYNHRGEVPGIRGDVDMNVFCGSEQEWEAFLNGAVWPYTERVSSDSRVSPSHFQHDTVSSL